VGVLGPSPDGSIHHELHGWHGTDLPLGVGHLVAQTSSDAKCINDLEPADA
jgi:hypothetical protein